MREAEAFRETGLVAEFADALRKRRRARTWVSGEARGGWEAAHGAGKGANGGDESEGPKRLGREANTHSSVRMASIASISAAVRSGLAKDGASFDPVVVSSNGPGPFLSLNTTLFPRFFPAASNGTCRYGSVERFRGARGTKTGRTSTGSTDMSDDNERGQEKEEEGPRGPSGHHGDVPTVR